MPVRSIYISAQLPEGALPTRLPRHQSLVGRGPSRRQGARRQQLAPRFRSGTKKHNHQLLAPDPLLLISLFERTTVTPPNALPSHENLLLGVLPRNYVLMQHRDAARSICRKMPWISDRANQKTFTTRNDTLRSR